MNTVLKAWLAGIGAALLMAVGMPERAGAIDDVYFELGPLALTVPFKSASAVYMYDFNAKQNLVGGETPVASMWKIVEGTVGVVTSLKGQGTPFLGGNIIVGNALDKVVTLPDTFKIGGYGGYDFRVDEVIYGLKASIKLW